MLLEETLSLKEIIVTVLARQASVTAAWLRERIADEYREFSLQGIYKELSHLHEANVVVKAGDRYSLSLAWAFEFVELADKIYDTYIENPSRLSILPDENEKNVWQFSDIRKMDHYWVQVMLALIQQTDEKLMFQWLTHPWFHLIHSRLEDKFQSAMRTSGATDYIIVGGRTYLDRYFCKGWPQEIYQYSDAVGPFEAERNKGLNLVGDYILTIRYDKQFTEDIDAYFERIRSKQEVAAGEVLALFGRKMKIVLQLERNPKKAARLRGKFKRFFGL